MTMSEEWIRYNRSPGDHHKIYFGRSLQCSVVWMRAQAGREGRRGPHCSFREGRPSEPTLSLLPQLCPACVYHQECPRTLCSTQVYSSLSARSRYDFLLGRLPLLPFLRLIYIFWYAHRSPQLSLTHCIIMVYLCLCLPWLWGLF